MTSRWVMCTAPWTLAVLLTACAGLPWTIENEKLLPTFDAQNSSPLLQELSRMINAVPEEKLNSFSRRSAREALMLVAQGKFQEGSTGMNTSLKFDPTNSYLQFFNAFAYHLLARQGDKQKYDLAEQGYILAVQFDSSNWIARYFLATMYFEQRKFGPAQHHWAHVLLSIGEDPDVLFRMVSASYYAGDPVTAAACLERLHLLRPSDLQVLRLSALVAAAINRPEMVAKWMSLYTKGHPAKDELNSLQDRLNHWAEVHKGQTTTDVREKDRLGETSVDGSISSHLPSMIRTQGVGFPDLMRSQSEQGNFRGIQPEAADPPADQIGDQDPRAGQMVLVDVVIMRTEDTLSTLKGVNLLNALTLQFGGYGTPAYSKSFSSSGSNQSDYININTQLTRAITIPSLSYSLNIVNSNTNLNEMLARPTIAALNGVKSEFFSGTTLTAAVISSNSNGGGSVQIEKEIGVKLSILPIFIDESRIRMKVEAQRTFVKPPSSDVNYTYKLETSKIMVSANVVMQFGETLILGGLSEKETSRARDGIPFLQDIPGVQYIFSSKKADDFQRSVLMLITPRDPQYTYKNDIGSGATNSDMGSGENLNTSGSASMRELRARYGDWFKPYPNMASVFSQLNSSSMYREFRTGDVTLEKWDKQKTSSDRLRQAMGFLFY